VLQEDKFVVSFAGTSVTAGHDNKFEQSVRAWAHGQQDPPPPIDGSDSTQQSF